MIITALSTLGLCGCKTTISNQPDTEYFYSNYYEAHLSETSGIYCNEKGQAFILEYENLTQSPLCSKPNCTHTANDCIVNRLNGRIPVLYKNDAYYFVDDEPVIEQNDDQKPELILGSTLCCYDFTQNTEKQLLRISGGTVLNYCFGMIVNDGKLFYMKNAFSRNCDENGNIQAYSPNGGAYTLHTVQLADLKQEDLGSLYDVEELTRYYPLTPNSGEVSMKGIFENKIYFTVSFVEGDSNPAAGVFPAYRHYVTYYDLTDGTYHGTPTDYENIEFARVGYLSDDYLAILRDKEITVYRKNQTEPIILNHECFNDFQQISVFDDMLFCDGKAFDLNTKDVRETAVSNDKSIIAKYGDFFIISDYGMQTGFEKIPAEQLLK